MVMERTFCFAPLFTLSSPSARFLSRTFPILLSLLPPPPAVSSTLICLPSIVEWCSARAFWSELAVGNSTNAQPFDLVLVEALGVSRRTVGGTGEHWAK